MPIRHRNPDRIQRTGQSGWSASADAARLVELRTRVGRRDSPAFCRAPARRSYSPASEIFLMFDRSVHAVSLAIVAAVSFSACRSSVSPSPRPRDRAPHSVVPAPVTIDVSPADSFLLTPRTGVYIDGSASAEVQAIGDYTANMISLVVGATARRIAADSVAPDSSIALALNAARADLGEDGYELSSTRTRVSVVAAQPAGLFHGVQTLRQLFPAAIELQGRYNKTIKLPVAHVVDVPRFTWRGGMLDVSRHFLPPADVKRFIDLYALYKLNRLHLHLSDDQGWRIQIKSWPRLAEVGGQTAIGGAPAGYYTQEQYADLVAYAKARYITIVPEIDMPGHITAALTAYPDLGCDRIAPEPFMKVGGPPNTLCVSRDSVYTFVNDVVREIVAAAPTPYFHIGGDERSEERRVGKE